MHDYSKTKVTEQDLIMILAWTLSQALPTNSRNLAALLRDIDGARDRIAAEEREGIDTLGNEVAADAARLELIVPELVGADYQGWISPPSTT